MKKVNTVLGTISVDRMGPTLMHEHLIFASNGWDVDALAKHYELDELSNLCAAAVGEVKQYGIRTIVDAEPTDAGRNVELQRIVAEKTGLNFICCTGMFTEAEGRSCYWKFRGQMMDIVTELYETFMYEITVGIGKTGIKAGFIKVASAPNQITPYEEKVFKAAARAQKETGVPIYTHTEKSMGPEQASLLIGEGADPQKIVIGHMCCNSQMEYQTAVLDKGVYIGFDRWGDEFDYPDRLRKATITGLLSIGHADRIVLSQDCTTLFMGRPFEIPDFVKPLLVNWTYTHVCKNIIPQLKDVGVTDEQVNKMLVENPKNLFGG
ncbi:MAG: phosphotriesterase-related protein [Dehalococcoidia bacterium]